MNPGNNPIPESACLSVAYLAPVSYYSKFLLHRKIIIERYDHYQKQTYRNRCIIYSANGPIALSIPVLKGPSHKVMVKDLRIDNGRSWRKLHRKGIESAYRSAPYYEFYIDEILPFFEKSYDYLLDLNLQIQQVMMDNLQLEPELTLTTAFEAETAEDAMDYRELIHPKKEFSADPYFKPEPYEQVFSDRFGFISNLSIMDLLFNKGPDAVSVLEKSIRRKAFSKVPRT